MKFKRNRLISVQIKDLSQFPFGEYFSHILKFIKGIHASSTYDIKNSIDKSVIKNVNSDDTNKSNDQEMSTKQTRKIVKTLMERRKDGNKTVCVYSCDICNKGYWTLPELKNHHELGCSASDLLMNVKGAIWLTHYPKPIINKVDKKRTVSSSTKSKTSSTLKALSNEDPKQSVESSSNIESDNDKIVKDVDKSVNNVENSVKNVDKPTKDIDNSVEVVDKSVKSDVGTGSNDIETEQKKSTRKGGLSLIFEAAEKERYLKSLNDKKWSEVISFERSKIKAKKSASNAKSEKNVKFNDNSELSEDTSLEDDRNQSDIEITDENIDLLTVDNIINVDNNVKVDTEDSSVNLSTYEEDILERVASEFIANIPDKKPNILSEGKKSSQNKSGMYIM